MNFSAVGPAITTVVTVVTLLVKVVPAATFTRRTNRKLDEIEMLRRIGLTTEADDLLRQLRLRVLKKKTRDYIWRTPVSWWGSPQALVWRLAIGGYVLTMVTAVLSPFWLSWPAAVVLTSLLYGLPYVLILVLSEMTDKRFRAAYECRRKAAELVFGPLHRRDPVTFVFGSGPTGEPSADATHLLRNRDPRRP